MKRCLCPGRPLQPGRRPLTVHPLCSSRRSVSHHSPGSQAQKQRQPPCPEARTYPTRGDLRFLVQYFRRGHLVPPVSKENRKYPEAWVPYLKQCLPQSPIAAVSNKKPGPARPLSSSKLVLDRCSHLAELMYAGRERLQSDLLVFIGFKSKDWPAVHALLNTLVDGYDLLAPHISPRRPSPGLDWGSASDSSLDELTASSTACPKPVPADPVSLDTLTYQPLMKDLSEKFLSQIWQSLGSLILEAADQSPEESKIAMSYVFRILARLHHSGLISDRVYRYPEFDTSQLISRPPGLQLLSGHIMSVLSDAAWLEHQAAVDAQAATAGEESPYLPIKMGVRELGPEIWLELILWCCVEHGHPKEGAWLVNQMQNQNGAQSWKIESWAPLLQRFDLVEQTNISTEQSWRRPDSDAPPQSSQSQEKPPFNGLGHRTISSEVVTALRHSLANKIYLGIGWTGYRPKHLLRLSAPLSSLVDPVECADDLRPTDSASNWYMVRFLEAGGMQPARDPLAFEQLLRSHNKVVPPWWDSDDMTSVQHLNELTKEEIYDGSAYMIGLIEYNIRAYAADRQSGRTFHEYAWLVNIIDASKARHIETFFKQLGQFGATDVTFFGSHHPRSLNILESPVPQLSIPTFADMLDLATASRAFDFGEWLLFSNDVDGPSIPRRLYGEQCLAPSILRFAAATENSELCKQVISSLKPPLSVNTIKALINYHISAGHWDRVTMMLNYLRDHKAQSWGYSNIALLAAVIIRRDASVQRKLASGATVSEEETENLARAEDLFVRFFNGEFNTRISTNRSVGTFQQKLLFRLRDVLCSLPGPLPEIIAQAKLEYVGSKRDRSFQISPVSFHVLLAAVVDMYGSFVGKQLWDKWCLNPLSPSRKLTQHGGVSRLHVAYERKRFQGDPHFDPRWHEYARHKAINPNLNTVRIIAQAAIRELKDKLQSQRAAMQSQTETSTQTSTSDTETETGSTSPPNSPSTKPELLETTPFDVPKDFCRTQTGEGLPPSSTPEAVLDFCVDMYFRLGLPEHEIDRETEGHVTRMRYRGVFGVKAKETRDSVRNIRDDPWMDDSWYNPVGGWPVPVFESLDHPSVTRSELPVVQERVFLPEASSEAYQ